MSATQLLARLRAVKGYQRTELLDKIEKEHGRGFRKTIQETITPRSARVRPPAP